MAKSLDIVVTGLDKVIEKLAKYPTVAADAIKRGLRLGALVLVREVKETIYLGHAQGHLKGDSKRLRDSIHWQVDEAASEAAVGTNVIYAPVHEFGATIHAKNAPYLAFQLPGYRTGSGKLTAFGKLAATGEAVNAAGEAVNATGWVRMKEVTIPPRPYLKPAIDNKGDEAADEIVKAVKQVLAP